MQDTKDIIEAPAAPAAKPERPRIQTRDGDGKPLFTDRQLIEASKMAVGRNAHLARTPQLLEELAMQVPLSRQERMVKCLTPRLARGPNLKMEADPRAVETFVEQARPGDPQELVAKIAQAVGLSSLGAVSRIGRRVSRFTRSSQGQRVPSHIRDKAIVLSAMAQGVRMAFPAQTAAAEAATA